MLKWRARIEQPAETAVEAARTPEAVRATRNTILLGKMLASISQEDSTEGIVAAVSETLVKATETRPSSRLTYWRCSATSVARELRRNVYSSIVFLKASATRSNSTQNLTSAAIVNSLARGGGNIPPEAHSLGRSG